MFKFLKDKLKGAVSKFSSKVEEEVKEEEEIVEEPPKESFFDKLKKKFKKEEKKDKLEDEKKEEVKEIKIEKEEIKVEEKREAEPEVKVEEKKEEIKIEKEEIKVEEPKDLKEEAEKVVEEKEEIKEEISEELKEEEKNIFGRLKEKFKKKKISENKFNELFWDLEVVLLENNVAVEVIEKIKNDLKEEIVDKPLQRGKIFEIIQQSLKKSINDLFVDQINFLEKVKSKKPYVICFVGINGSGKTTSMAKIAYMLKENNLSIVFAASDTFRAASIEQLEQHADKLGVKVIKHDYGSDPAAVAFDTIKYAKSKGIDVVLIDTAGRLHSNVNLMDEMKKIIRVAQPDFTIFVGESITGNDCVEQAQKFKEAIPLDGIILSKADVDEKGGTAISISYVTKKPILYLGVGQGYEDLREFNSDVVIEGLGIV